MSKNTVTYFKEIKDVSSKSTYPQIFLKISNRKGHASQRQFEEELKPLMIGMATFGERLKDEVCKEGQIPDVNAVKLSKYFDQILISIHMLAPTALFNE